MPDDNRIVKVISELRVGISGLERDMKDAETEVKRGNKAITDSVSKMQREIDAMWKERESEEARVAKQTSQMWEQRAKEQRALDQQRLKHGMDVERQLANEAKRQAQSVTSTHSRMMGMMEKPIKELLPSIQAQMAATQARLKAEKMSSSELMTQARTIRDQVSALQERLNISGKLSVDEEKRARSLREEAAILKANAQTAISDAKKPITFGDQVSSQFDRRLSWFASGAAIIGSYNEAKQAVEVVKQMEGAMTNLNRVMTDSTYISSDMRKELSKLGNEFGFQFDTVSKIATAWAQAGYNAADTLEATRATLLGLNTAEMDVESGTQSLIAIMGQWGLQATDLVTIIDQLNLAADRYPVSTQDLVDGLMRSGAAARSAGIDFQQTIGMLVAMREASGRTGKEIGTSLNSILSFATRKESLDTFQRNGITVFADATTGKLRPLIDVLNDVATNWNQLSDEAKDAMASQAEAAGLFSEEMADALGEQEQWTDLQKRDITTAAAAAYRRNYLLALLQNFGRVQETVNTLQDAEGYSLKENAKAMETYSKKVEQLKANLQDALYSLAEESGLLGGLKNMVDGLRSGVEWWNNLDGATRQALLTMAAINTAILALGATTRAFAGVSLATAITQMLTFVKTAGLAAAASKALDVALSTMFGPVGLVVMGLTALGGAIAYFHAEAKAAAEAVKNAGAQADELDKLRTRYLELADKANKTKTEEDELRGVSERLVELMPQLADRFDEFGRAMLSAGDVASQTKQRISELRDETRKLLEEQAKVGQERLPGLESDLAALQERYDKIRSAMMQGPDALYPQLYIGLQPWDSAATKMAKAEKSLAGLRDRMKEITDQINVYKSAIAAIEPPHVPSDNEIALNEKLAMMHWKPTPKPTSTTDTTATTSGIKALSEAILGEVTALEQAGNATERYIGILSNRLDYEAREGATAEELAQADKDRAHLLETLTQRQEELAQQAAAARQAIVQLRAAQSSLNLSTDEGKSAYQELGRQIDNLIEQAGTFENPVGALSEQWWKLQKQKVELERQDNAITTETLRNLTDLKESYQKGLTPLDAYVKALGRLENQAGLSADALKQLNEEQGAGLLAQWTRDLEAEITKGDSALKAFGNDLESIFDNVSKASKKTDLATMMNTLRGSLSSLTGSYALPTNTIDAATATTKSLIGDVLNGKFAPNADALMKMDRAEFLAAVTQGKDDLMSAAQSVNALLVNIGNERDAVIRSIDAQIKPINDVLKQFDVLDKQNAANELKDAMTSSLNNLYGKTDKLPGLPTVDQLKTLVGSIKVSDLGALAPDKFAATLKQNMNNLRGLATTTKSYLEGVTKGYAAQIDAIDAQLRSIDAGLEERLGKLQAQLDELDQQDKTDQRAKEKADLDARKKSINDELAWRLQREDLYTFEIASLRKQQAELDKEAADKQREWDRADKRESIQGEMDAERTKADKKKAALEDQKRILQEQQQMWEQALSDVLSYVNGEIAGLKELGQERVNSLETEKQQTTERYSDLLTALGNVKEYVNGEISEWQHLADERKAIEEKAWSDDKDSIKSIINSGTLGVLALMTANGKASGEGYVNSIIEGVNNRKGALQQALDDLTRTTAQYQAQTTTTTTTTTSQMQNANVKAMAEGAYVKARPGVGVRAIVGEGKYDEWVQPVNTIQPVIDRAVLSSLNTYAGNNSMMLSAADYAGMLEATVNRIASAFPDKVEANFTLPDGTIQRVVVNLFEGAGLLQAVRAK